MVMDLFCNQNFGFFNNNLGGSNFFVDLYEDCFIILNFYFGNDCFFCYFIFQDVILVIFNLMNMSNNFDFFVYNCSGFGGCIDRSIRSGFGDESIMINNLFGIYYLIVDV